MKIIKQETTNNYNKTICDNGLTIISERVHGMRSYSAGICVKIGARDDYKNQSGIAHFMEHAAFRHTKNRTSKQIANQFEILGAFSNAFTTKEITCFYVRAINEHFKKTFELLSDITLNTVFVDEEIEKEKLVIIEELKSYEDDPEEYVFDLADKSVFTNHQLGMPIVGTQETVSNIYSADLEKFHKQYYKPSNIVVCVAGDIEHELIHDTVITFFNGFKQDTNEYPKRDIPANVKNQTIEVKRQIQQAHLILGKRTKGIRHQERYPIAVLNALFGDGMSSRLYQNLREKYGLAYSIYSSLYHYVDCGSWYIYAATGEREYNRSIELIFDEMKKIITKLPTKKELQRAKEQLKTATIIELESMSSRMQEMLKNEISVGRYESISQIIDKIEAVDMDDVAQVAEEYFAMQDWSISAVLPE